MKKMRFIAIVLICVCLLGCIAVAAVASVRQDSSFILGEFFKKANDTEKNIPASSLDTIVAQYGNHKITKNTLEYYRNVNSLTTNNQPALSDKEIIDQLLKNIILLEEAEKLGLSATSDEIEDMVQSNIQAYETSDGKEFIDSYCHGAGITVEEYFALIRDQIPEVIARQKLKDSLGRAYCEEHGYEFTKVNPPAGMQEYIDQYVNYLFDLHQDEITYFLHSGESS